MKKIVQNIYRKKIAEADGVSIWIVDGARVRHEFYTDFVMGGHDGRYKFIPPNEIWIDSSISLEELEYTIAHERLERTLMIEQRLGYEEAHDRATELEATLREEDARAASVKESQTPEVTLGTYLFYGKE